MPLGCICVRRDFSERKAEIESLIRSSIDAAFARPEDTYGFVRGYAQYLDDDVLKNTYMRLSTNIQKTYRRFAESFWRT